VIDPGHSEEVVVSFRTLAMLGGIVLLAVHFYRLFSRVSRHRDGHQEIDRPSQLPQVEAALPRPRVRALSSPVVNVAADDGAR
jgi:hypothetical protein